MKEKTPVFLRKIFFIPIALFVLLIINSCVSKENTTEYRPNFTILSGPSGGTFIKFAKGIAHIADEAGIDIDVKTSYSSFVNVTKLEAKKADFAIAYATLIYHARHGLLKNAPKKHDNIMVLGYLYGSPAHLVVKKNSGIESAFELIGKKIGVGKRHSGVEAHAELFFKELNIWDKVNRKHMGYNDSAYSFVNGKLDAFWLMTPFPTASVMVAAKRSDLDILSISIDGQKVNYFEKHPYFEKITIPANTYEGVSHDIQTYQDSTLLIAHKDVPEDVVYQLLERIYSEKGKSYLLSLAKGARMMSDNNGSFGVSTPLHSGAIKYYREQNK